MTPRAARTTLAIAMTTALSACGSGGADMAAASADNAFAPRIKFLPCGPQTDSSPSSLGADGWASVGAQVTGGCGALPENIHTVTNRAELVRALYAGKIKTVNSNGVWEQPDDTPKIIYVQGTIDLNVDDDNKPLTEEDYMKRCNWTAHATYYDPVTRNETGSGGFFGAYKAAYDPNVWNRQDAVPRAGDGRLAPPAPYGALEDARACFQKEQEKVIVIRVGSNTSIIGKGADARIINGNLRLGWLRADDRDGVRPAKANYKASNVVIRNIAFEDSYDMFPGWDPTDSFSISTSGGSARPYMANCQAVYDEAANKGPHMCRGGRWNSEYDTISVENAEHVWIDHNSFSDGARPDKRSPGVWTTEIVWTNGQRYAPFNESTQKVQHHDGALDVTLGGTKVTASYNHFRNHDKTNLLGGSDVPDALGYGPGKINVTFHHNYWQNTVQRMPRVRFGQVHVMNNYYEGTRVSGAADYLFSPAWTLGTAAKLYTENNLFEIAGSGIELISFSSTADNAARCAATGYTVQECGTYYHDVGTYLNGALRDVYADALAARGTASTNAPLQRLDPSDPAVFWTPSKSYSYTPAAVGTAAERDALKMEVVTRAGAGKL